MAKKRQAPIPKVKTSATVDQQEKSTTKNPETTTLSAGLTSTLISTVIIDEVSPPDARKKQKVGYHKESEDPTPYCPPFVTRDGKIIMVNDSGLANVEVAASALHRARLPVDSHKAQNATSAGLIDASYRAIYEMNLYQKNITDWLVELETENNDLVARMTAIGIAHKEEIQRMETAHKDEVRQMHNLAVESEKKMKDELAVQVAVVDKLRALYLKLTNEVNGLLERDYHISENSLALPIQEIGLVMGTTKLVGEAATQKIMKMVREHLMDDQVDIIGVYGMGGVGKTTIMKNINDQLIKESTHFSKVVWVTGSKDGNIRKLQMCIGKDFNIDLLSEPDENRWSSQLLTRLPRMGRILFILDDMWEAFSLADIGIPNLKENNCKLVLTTRSLEVCRRMGCNEPIKVELLSEDEAWELFIDIVDKKLAPEVEKVAKAVAAKCSRLPLAIVTIASAMKGNEDIQEWRNALSDLRDRTYTNLGMEAKVIGSLKSSYNKLSEPEKKCFQYCALYPKDYEIVSKDLIDHWVMDELISEKRIQRELDRGHGILNKLVHSCMLERDYNKDSKGNCINEFVKMHDLVRDMAIGTVETNPRFVVKAGLFLGELLDEKVWEEDAEKISFMNCGIEKIAVSPNCPRLTTLLLGGNNKLKYIADAFFARMQNLRVLNLSGSSITSLPESLSELVNLHVLDASWNKALRSVPSLQKLRSLRVLRLQKTGIRELPHGMEALVNLRRLDISETRLSEIPVSLITNLSLLQELLIHPCCISFSDPQRSLDSFSHLERVSLKFNNLSDFICYARSKTLNHLDNFSFAVGSDAFDRIRGRNEVHITNNFNEVSEDTLVLPQNTEVLQMTEFNGLTSFSELACLKDVRGLRTCCIEHCSGMECILSSSEHRNEELQFLEELYINWCPKFITLCKGVAAPGILPSLKTLLIVECSNLKYLFASFKLFCQLQKLVSLRIDDCPEFEKLIASEEAEEEQVSTEGSNTASPTLLEVLYLYGLPKLKTLFSKPMMHYFQNVKKLIISGCHSLKYLFSFEMLEHLKHLQIVDIKYCFELEAVIAEAEVGGDSTIILLPSLTELNLSGLPKLKSICRRGEMVCESLQTVDVYRCAELKRLPLLRSEDQLPPPSLKRIKGGRKWWDSLEWDRPFLKTILQPCFEEDKDEREIWKFRDFQIKRASVESQSTPPIHQRIKGRRKQLNSQILKFCSEDVLQASTTTAASLLPMTSEQNNTQILHVEGQLTPPTHQRIKRRRKQLQNCIDEISQHTSSFSIPNFDPNFQIGIASVEGQSTPPIHQRIKGRRKQLNSQNILNLSGEDVFQAPTTTTAASLLSTTSEQNNTLNQTGHDKLFDFDLNELPVLQGEDEDEDGGNSQQIQLFPV